MLQNNPATNGKRSINERNKRGKKLKNDIKRTTYFRDKAENNHSENNTTLSEFENKHNRQQENEWEQSVVEWCGEK
jgi:hypothetical protein